MLALSRRKGETIVIGDDIEVTVIEIKGSQVVLGIKAPGDVSVHRSEVYIRIHREKHRGSLPAEAG